MTYRLVTLAAVKRSLRIDHSDEDEVLDLYIGAASQAIMVYLKTTADALGLNDSPQDVPEDVAMATIILVGHFYRDPDGDPDKAFNDGDMPRTVVALLRQRRDPAFA